MLSNPAVIRDAPRNGMASIALMTIIWSLTAIAVLKHVKLKGECHVQCRFNQADLHAAQKHVLTHKAVSVKKFRHTSRK